jgi:hypothetical protein
MMGLGWTTARLSGVLESRTNTLCPAVIVPAQTRPNAKNLSVQESASETRTILAMSTISGSEEKRPIQRN